MFESVLRTCPYCGETVEVSIDEGGAATQSYIEDCSVCCRPWQVEVTQGADGEWDVTLRSSDD